MLPLALRAGLSNGVGVTDVLTTLDEFQRVNSVILSLSILVTGKGKSRDLTMKVTAYADVADDAEPVHLASSEFSLLRERFQTMDAAIMFSLYQIDFLLGAHEWEKIETK